MPGSRHRSLAATVRDMRAVHATETPGRGRATDEDWSVAMGRYRRNGSYGHACRMMCFWGGSVWRISWTCDRYYSGVRCRFPTRYKRITDEAGAKRFCKRWGLEMPTDANGPEQIPS